MCACFACVMDLLICVHVCCYYAYTRTASARDARASFVIRLVERQTCMHARITCEQEHISGLVSIRVKRETCTYRHTHRPIDR